MKNRHISFIVIVYIAVNILGLIIYYIMPKENFAQANTGVNLEQLENMKTGVVDDIRLLADKNIGDKYNIKSHSFNYEEKALEVIFKKEDQQVFINRKNSDDNKIEVYWYSGSMFVNGMDFANMIKGPSISLVDNKLIIECEKQRYNFNQFSKDVMITQFYENKDKKDRVSTGSFGSGIIYIKIPLNLKVLGDVEYKYINN